MSCVLPFSTFIGKAFKKIDEFISKRYTVKCIIFGIGRSAYSDNTNLTEVLFVAEKGTPKIDHKFVLVATKEPPTGWSDDTVKAIHEQIEKTEQTGLKIDSKLAITMSFHQTDLIKETVGLNQLVLSFNQGFAELLGSLNSHYQASGKVKPFKKVAQSKGYDLFAYELRIKGGAYYGSSALSISASEKRMKKKVDTLVYLDSNEKELRVRNKFSGEIAIIPRSHVIGQIRRFSNIDHINITEDTEFIISKYYDKLTNLIQTIYSEKDSKIFEQRIKQDWAKKVNHGVANFAFVRRINLAAPGTKLLALYSANPRFLSANSWGVRNLYDDDAKIICLWFNSTLFLMELLSKHSPTEGSWGQLDERYIYMMQCIDPTQLTVEERQMLLGLFSEIQNESFPTLIQQLRMRFSLRKKIDSLFLKIIGVNERDQQSLIDNMFNTTRERIENMKESMESA